MLRLRPHHILDIIRNYGHGFEFKPHPYGHAVHTVAECILSNLDTKIELVKESDAICAPCMFLRSDRRCDDVLSQLEEPVSKQVYNDSLDEKLFIYLGLSPGTILSFKSFLDIVRTHVPGIEKLCTHPKEDVTFRLAGFEQGLQKLKI